MSKLCENYVTQSVVTFLTCTECWQLISTCRSLFLRRTCFCHPTLTRGFVHDPECIVNTTQYWVPETFAYKSVTLTCGSASFARRTLNYNLQKELLAAPQSHFPGTSLTSLTLLALDKPFDTKMSLPMTLRELIVDYSALRINLMVDLKHLVNLRNVEAYGCSMRFPSHR